MLYTRNPVYAPLDGTVNIPETIEFNWKHNADYPAFAYDDTDHITEISNLEFGRACHRAAHALRPGCDTTTRPTVGFIALTDVLQYQAIVVGMMRANLVPFPISPRNTPAAIANLLMQSSSHRLIATCETLSDLIKAVKKEIFAKDPTYGLSIEELPSLDVIFPRLGVERKEDPFSPYPAIERRPDLSEVCMYLHSSGSTGLPKLIPQTHKALINWADYPCGTGFRDFTPRARIAGMHLPPFHTLGFMVQVLYALRSCTTIGLFPPVAKKPHLLPIMPTPENILDHTRRTKSNGIIAIPSIIQVWSQDPKSVEILKSLEFVVYSGGGISPKIGESLYSAGVKLYTSYGTTETGSTTHPFKRRKEDEAAWAYIEFGENKNIRWMPQGDGTYECQFRTCNTHVLSIENLPDIRGYATSDLFVKHPTKDYLWKIVGRIDDVVIHSSGEKTVPAPIEDVVMSSPYVMGVIVFGQAHDRAGILIEPKAEYAIDIEDEGQLDKFRSLLWPTIDEANKVAPSFSRIFKEMILVTHKDKPLPRTGKGTLMRKAALKEYRTEIETLYASVESAHKTEWIAPPASWDATPVIKWLVDHVRELNSGKAISPCVDIFEHGFDSLSATILRSRITRALQSTTSKKAKAAVAHISQNIVYAYPSIDRLTDYLVNLVADPNMTENVKCQSHVDQIETMIDQYSNPWRTIRGNAQPGTVVLLTGSTGNLGSHILEALLRDPRILRIYAFNRPSSRTVSLLHRHKERFDDKGFNKALLTSQKLTFIEGDTSHDNLGVPLSVYNELRNSVDVIIHSAWRLNFNLSLSSFDSSMRGTRNLIDFAHDCINVSRLKFVFTSSIASAFSWGSSRRPYPEETINDARFAIGNGYGESKYVSERLLVTSGIDACSLRIGQISGGYSNGAWAITDWVPILVKSSLALGVLPLANGVVSWAPVDAVSNCITELTFHNERLPPVLNVVHPRPTEWNTVIKLIGDALVAQKKLESPLAFVSFQKWFSILEAHAQSANELRIPAVKLLDFFRQMSVGDLQVTSDGRLNAEAGGLTNFSTSKTQDISKAMRDLKPLVSKDIEQWVKYWDATGLFNDI
ncbi:putative aminoadipate reductase [Phlegmacium glaucopus]|nr:putative aminoadipate reductase [Phlegmacium glaucopus]